MSVLLSSILVVSMQTVLTSLVHTAVDVNLVTQEMDYNAMVRSAL